MGNFVCALLRTKRSKTANESFGLQFLKHSPRRQHSKDRLKRPRHPFRVASGQCPASLVRKYSLGAEKDGSFRDGPPCMLMENEAR